MFSETDNTYNRKAPVVHKDSSVVGHMSSLKSSRVFWFFLMHDRIQSIGRQGQRANENTTNVNH